MQVTYRNAVLEDATSLTELMLRAGGDILQFVLDELAPGVRAKQLYMHMITSLESECSYQNCIVATIRAGQSEMVIGMVNAFPTARLKGASSACDLSDRETHLKPRTEMQDWDSYFLNQIAVFPEFSGQGIAEALMKKVFAQGILEGFDRITLHVWVDNEKAIRLYRRMGFMPVGVADILWHPDLPHRGGSILMCKYF
jgi:GNAT superfamily N-acetyltransferase